MKKQSKPGEMFNRMKNKTKKKSNPFGNTMGADSAGFNAKMYSPASKQAIGNAVKSGAKYEFNTSGGEYIKKKRKAIKLVPPSKGRKPKGPHGRAAVKALGRTKTTGNFARIEAAKGKGAAIAAYQNALKGKKKNKKKKMGPNQAYGTNMRVPKGTNAPDVSKMASWKPTSTADRMSNLMKSGGSNPLSRGTLKLNKKKKGMKCKKMHKHSKSCM